MLESEQFRIRNELNLLSMFGCDSPRINMYSRRYRFEVVETFYYLKVRLITNPNENNEYPDGLVDLLDDADRFRSCGTRPIR